MGFRYTQPTAKKHSWPADMQSVLAVNTASVR